MPRNRLVAFHDPPPPPFGASLRWIAAVDEALEPASWWPERPLEHLTLFMTVSGSASVAVGGHTAVMHPGTVLALAKGARFTERTPDRGWWQVRYLMLDGPLVAPLQAQLMRHPSCLSMHPAAPTAWATAITSSVHLALREPPGWSLAFLHQLTGVLHALLQHPAPIDEPGLIERVSRAVDRSPGQPWPVARLAAVAGLGTTAFAHRFRAVAGVAPATWLRRRRLDLAATLLAEGLPVGTVAARLGFSDAFHLSRLYRAHFGQPPSRHRKAAVSPLHRAGT